MRRFPAILLALAATLACVPAAGAAPPRERPDPEALFGVPEPAVPFRDAVIDSPSASVARAVASDAGARYPVNDGHGRSVFIRVSELCEVLCSGVNPQAVADFLGSLPHRGEMWRLSVDLVTAGEIASRCGAGTLACYYPGQGLMVVRGDDSSAGGVSRNFVIAHEYGHHLADNRSNPPWRGIDRGPKYWATYERVCQGVRAGRYHPGDQGRHYYANPGEAFAEAYAFNRFPNETSWGWDPSLRPDANALRALRRDALRPWSGRNRALWRSRLPLRGRNRIGRRFFTPADGIVSVHLRGAKRRPDLNLELRSANNQRRLRVARGAGSRETLNYTVCGRGAVRAVVRRASRGRGGFRVAVLRP